MFYDFTVHGDEVFCREAYSNAEALLAHLESVKPELDKALSLATLIRLEIHGPASELDKLRGPVGALQPAWFVRHRGVEL